MISTAVTVRVISESMVEGHSIPAMSTTDFLSSLHPQHQYFHGQYYSSPTTNNIAAGTQMTEIIYGGEMSSTYCQDPRVQGHQHNSTTLDVDVDYEVQEDNDYELLAGLINIHVEKEKEEERPWEAAAVSSWEWPRFGGTLESVIDQAPCLVPLIINVPDHGNEEVAIEDEEDIQEYCHMAPQVVPAEMENTVVQSKRQSMCNMEWMTVEDKGEHNPCYSAGHNRPPPPSHHSQREAMKIKEKRQMQRGKSSTTVSSSNKRSKATILHNKSERKRRGRIKDRMDTLQKLVPNINKTDKASMLDQVIEYVKKLQTQNDQMMNMRLGMFDNNNMPVSVHPMMMMHYITTMQAMQQQQHHQQQMSMMAQMGMGMSMNPTGLVMMPTGSVVLPNMRQE